MNRCGRYSDLVTSLKALVHTGVDDYSDSERVKKAWITRHAHGEVAHKDNSQAEQNSYAGEAKIQEIVGKQGFVSFKKPEAVKAFMATHKGDKWGGHRQPDGSIRFFPLGGSYSSTIAYQKPSESHNSKQSAGNGSFKSGEKNTQPTSQNDVIGTIKSCMNADGSYNREKVTNLVTDISNLEKKVKDDDCPQTIKDEYFKKIDARNQIYFPCSGKDVEYAKNITSGDKLEQFDVNGIKTPVINYDGRAIVMVNVGDMKIPFYKSTGKGQKNDVREGRFYPFFGVGSGGWLNKTSGRDINKYYGSGLLRAISRELDSKYNDVDIKKCPKVELVDGNDGYNEDVHNKINEHFHDVGVNAQNIGSTHSGVVTANIKSVVDHVNGLSNHLNGRGPKPLLKSYVNGSLGQDNWAAKTRKRKQLIQGTPIGKRYKTPGGYTLEKKSNLEWEVKTPKGYTSMISHKAALGYLQTSDEFERDAAMQK